MLMRIAMVVIIIVVMVNAIAMKTLILAELTAVLMKIMMVGARMVLMVLVMTRTAMILRHLSVLMMERFAGEVLMRIVTAWLTVQTKVIVMIKGLVKNALVLMIALQIHVFQKLLVKTIGAVMVIKNAVIRIKFV